MNLFAASTWWWVLLGMLAAEAAAAVALPALVQRRIRSAAWRRTLWQLTALALLALPLAELGGLGREAARRVNARIEARRPPPPEARPVPVVHRPADVVPLAAAPRTRDLVEPERPLPLVPPPKIVPPGHLAHHWPGWLWLLGCGLLLGRAISRRAAFRRHRDRHHHEAPVELVKRVAAVAQKLGLAAYVRVVESEHLSGPVAFGLFRPTIGLPVNFAEQFTPAQQDAMLAHELAHLAARDAVWQLLADLATAVWWWHPLAWWTRRQLQSASELAADEASLVVRDGPTALAESLVKLGAQMTEPQLPGGLGIKGFRSGLGRRVERLLRLDGQEWQAPGRWKLYFARVIGPVVLVMAVVLGGAWVWPASMLVDETPFRKWRKSWPGMLAVMSPAAKTTDERDKPKDLFIQAGDHLIIVQTRTVPAATRPNEEPAGPLSNPLKAPDAPPNDPPPPLLHPTLPPKLATGSQTNSGKERTVLPMEFSSPRLLHPTLPPKPVAKAWQLPVQPGLLHSPNPYLRTTQSHTSAQIRDLIEGIERLRQQGQVNSTEAVVRQLQGRNPSNKQLEATLNNIQGQQKQLEVLARLDQIVFREVGFDHKPLKEVVALLTAAANHNPLAGERISFSFEPRLLSAPRAGSRAPAAESRVNWEQATVTIQPPRRDVTLLELLQAVVQGTHVEPGVRVDFMGAGRLIMLIARQAPGTGANGGNRTEAEIRNTAAELLHDAVRLYHEGDFSKASYVLYQIWKADSSNQAARYYQDLVRYAQAGAANRSVNGTNSLANKTTTPLPSPAVPPKPLPEASPRTAVPNTSTKARQKLLAKLDQIQIGEVFFDGLPLEEVVKWLRLECLKHDPEKKGVNFILNPFLNKAPSSTGAATNQAVQTSPPLLDAFGNPIAIRPPSPGAGLGSVIIKINPPLKDLTLHQALDVICKMAAQPIQFIVEDYAVVFMTGPADRYPRSFKTDPNTFQQGLQGVRPAPLPGTGSNNPRRP